MNSLTNATTRAKQVSSSGMGHQNVLAKTRDSRSHVWPGSTERVLVTEHVEGIGIGDAVIEALPQKERGEVRDLLDLFQ
jgi:hypothetical protein